MARVGPGCVLPGGDDAAPQAALARPARRVANGNRDPLLDGERIAVEVATKVQPDESTRL